MKRFEWLFPALFLGILLAGYGLIPLPTNQEKADSFGVDRGGKKVFYDLAARILPNVTRSSDSLVPADPGADVLVLLGPARYPDRAQWQTLHDWISGGRALVFAAKWQDPAIDLEPFGIEIVPTLTAGEEVLPPSEPDEPDKFDEPNEAETESAAAVETELVATPVDWRSFGQVRTTDPKASVMLSTGGTPQVVWQPVGEGVIVVSASDFVFSNLSVIEPSNALLAFRILETASPSGTIYFEEGLNAAGAPAVVGVLFEGPLRLPMLQLVLVTVLFAWMAGRRFGPLRSRGRAERRSLVEHAEALGSLHYRIGTSASLLGSYMDYFGKDLGIAHRAGAMGRRELHVVEGRSGAGRAASDTLARAVRAAKNPRLDRSRVASAIHSLAELRASAKRSGK